MVQAGAVNSSANTVASGSRECSAPTASGAEMDDVAEEMQPQRRVRIARRRIGMHRQDREDDSKPVPLRTARISKMLSAPASTRIATAISENDSSAPVIQRMTRASCCECHGD